MRGHTLGCSIPIELKNVYDSLSPIGRINWSRYKGLETGMPPFTIIPSDPLGNCICCPCNSVLCKLEVFVPKGTSLLSGDAAKIYLNYKLQLLPERFGLFMSRNQESRREIMVLVRIIDLMI